MNKPAFEVTLNGQKIATAQIESDFGVVTTIVTWVRRDDNSESLNVSISGRDSIAEKNIKWAAQDLKIGDKLVVSIIDETTTQTDEGVVEIFDSITVLDHKLMTYHKLKEELKEYLNEL
ncbi:hypothetical protein ASE92_07640 [Pedobacter sp. Leaf41]|uniref:hypothetical protein n=1 Tax=Pedobacter sp. Leaf41 TaxID=1736218 RepID=UPI00070292B4|nr:hypothetical protein [Pedobacter sp. Leaf41]KQN36001.1 hypothetical protein ASE92_07640 [Pedobacter sp. Leaf41]